MNQAIDLDNLGLSAEAYQPSDEVAERLGEVTLAPLIGPVAVGKSTCMDYVVSMDPSFGRVQSFTTRPMRAGEAEDEYRFLPHTDATLAKINSAAQRGDLVQCTVHPTTGYIYGSDIGDYQKPYMMLDTLATSMPAIQRLPFGRIVAMTIVTEPEQWQKRFQARSADPADARKRLLEGQASLRWSLDQGDSMIWINNTQGKLPRVGYEIRGIVTETQEANPHNRTIGERLLRAIEGLL